MAPIFPATAAALLALPRSFTALCFPPPLASIPNRPPIPPPFLLPVVMAQQLGPVASVLLKLPGMTALARRAAASYQAAVGAELRKYGT